MKAETLRKLDITHLISLGERACRFCELRAAMNILLINKYLYSKGGDAISTINTGKLLKKHGHRVIYWGMDNPKNPEYLYSKYFMRNVEFNKSTNLIRQAKDAANIIYSYEAKKILQKILKKENIELAHVNNFAHQISPSILDALKKARIPIVMTMRDFKLVCPAYGMLLNGKPCERCKKGRYYYCLINRCTKKSLSKSLLNTIEMYLHHRILKIYNLIDIFISPSQFMKNKTLEMGFVKRIVHLPNFYDSEEIIPKYDWDENSIVYYGRLSEEKGIYLLLEAVREIDNIRLKIIGEGPEKEGLLKRAIRNGIDKYEFLGFMSGDKLRNEIQKSIFVVLPSECYENNPRSIIEAFAMGKMAIGSRIGGIPELIIENVTGAMFNPGDKEDLKNVINKLIRDPQRIIEMGKRAREYAEREYNSEKHYRKLMEIYGEAIKMHNARNTYAS